MGYKLYSIIPKNPYNDFSEIEIIFSIAWTFKQLAPKKRSKWVGRRLCPLIRQGLTCLLLSFRLLGFFFLFLSLSLTDGVQHFILQGRSVISSSLGFQLK